MAAAGTGLASVGFSRLIPFIHQPDEIIPGVSTWYATSCRECPAGCGMIVRNRDARVVKCEGNPYSPVNRGKLCARGQAAVTGLYDPDRIKSPMRRTEQGQLVETSWDDAFASIGNVLSRRPRIAFLTDLQTTSLNSLMKAWLSAFGSDRLITYETINYEYIKAVNGGVVPSYRIDQSDFLISFAADFLETWVSPVEFARQFSVMREVKNRKRGTFVYVGPRVSMTAANADLRIILPPGMSTSFARSIIDGRTIPGIRESDVRTIAQGLKSASRPLILPGLDADSARAASILEGFRTSTLVNRNRPHALTSSATSSELQALISDMENGRIDMLVIYNANPVYSLPEASRFAKALKHVRTVISMYSVMDETTTLANWILPSNTPLESWGDYSPYPGQTNLMQPTMGTLFDTRQTGDILIESARSAGINPVRTFRADSFYEFLRRQWGFPVASGEDAESVSPEWESLVQRGGRWSETGAAPPASGTGVLPKEESSTNREELRLWAFPHIYFYDGRGANRRWLQEIPEPVTNAVWGTWAEIHPSTARKMNIRTDDMLEIAQGGIKVQIPAFVWEGVAPGAIAVPIGEGHSKYGRFASGTGVNILPLLTTPYPAVKVRRLGASKWVTRIRGSDKQHGRDIVQTVAISESLERTSRIRLPLPEGYGKEDFYPGHEYKNHRWAMTVDLNKCIGCHACETACYAENNVAVVGPEGIWRRREMTWLRIDRYIDWKESSPILFQPMLCQHCDAAPCEPVCPVYASAHSDEGLNMQIYNRCVGTRYCSHNCPYKVRRFNWFDYQWPSPLHYQLNPDVTVRSRGVMEKCTFCIQRIREAEMTALRENRNLRDGEVIPACVQTCPTGVYTFGDLKDPNSKVSRIVQSDPRAYQVLAELNTKPAVIYLKRIVERPGR